MVRRRICWPSPDAVCLEGGCLYCNDYRCRSVREIRRWAISAGLFTAFVSGIGNDFYNAETRSRMSGALPIGGAHVNGE